jgi:nucleotide-binding universal stress UspA family protein
MKFMVCYDDSDLSKDVVREAQKHAGLWDATLEIAKVVRRETPIKRSRLLEMEEQLEAEVKILFEDVEIPYHVQLDVDDIHEGEKIVELAELKKAKLIFLGIKKHSKVGKLLFGSTAQHIILKATCPVVTVNRIPKDA